MKKIGAGIGALALLVLPFMAMAQTDPGDVNINSVGSVLGLVLKLLALARTIFWIIAVAMILWAAFLYLTSGGDEKKTGQANKTIWYAVIAIAVALVATSVPYLVRSLLS